MSVLNRDLNYELARQIQITQDVPAGEHRVATVARYLGSPTASAPGVGSFLSVADSGAVTVTVNGTPVTLSLGAGTITGGLSASGSAANDFSGSTGTFLTSTGANSLAGAVTVTAATTPSITTAAGKTNSGFLSLLGKTSGGIKVLPADTSGYLITVTNATQSVGVATLTIPDFANVADTFVFTTLAQTLVAKTLTSPIINTPTIKRLTEDVTATNVIAASETGTTYFLDSATEFVSTLPAPAAGLNFTFIVGAAPSGASYTVVTNSSANIIKGNQNSVAGDAGDFGTADDTITFVDGQSVAGDKVEVHCDGTYWYAYAISKVAAGITFTQAS